MAERIEGSASGGVAMHTPYRTFPIYDGHGNMVATLARDGTDDYTLGAEKRYNAWGGVIASANTGSHKLIPNKAYCASLGHTVDGESGLIYMRARYYEPWTGRFISEDPGRDGMNWYSYGGNEPVGKVDFDGKVGFGLAEVLLLFAAFLGGYQIKASYFGQNVNPGASAIKAAISVFVIDQVLRSVPALLSAAKAAWFNMEMSKFGRYGLASAIIGFTAAYTMLLIGALLILDDRVDQVMSGGNQ